LALALVTAACGHDDEIGSGADIGPDIGGACATSSECTDLCLGPTAADGDYPGGFCSRQCARDADCPGGSVCMRRDNGVCLYPCELVGNCGVLGAGWKCDHKEAIGGGERNVCIGD